jgi:PTH1 family peptidyl-tRNA hydrolase
VVDELARRWRAWLTLEECAARCGKTPDGSVLLAEPQTWMNRSGYAARCLVERYELAASDLLVVYDEVALPLGKLRLRQSGSPGGHRGMESVLESLQTDQIARLRLGVGDTLGPPPGEDLVAHVLAPFAAAEQDAVYDMVHRAADACESWLAEGAEAAMRRFNG